jgi:hypothetical protein
LVRETHNSPHAGDVQSHYLDAVAIHPDLDQP